LASRRTWTGSGLCPFNINRCAAPRFATLNKILSSQAHDWQNSSQASATFLGLSPIAAFIVNSANPAADLGVVTAGAELRMASGCALMSKFDGEFGSGTQTYAGTARVRYVW
jgi:uncharacterized protein with beta-barrel porin domain